MVEKKKEKRVKKETKAKVACTFHLTKAQHKQAKMYAIENETSLQKMFEEAFSVWFKNKALQGEGV